MSTPRKISQLPLATSFTEESFIPIVIDGATRRIRPSVIANAGTAGTSADTGNISFDLNGTVGGIYNNQGGPVYISNYSYVTAEAETAWIQIPAGSSGDAVRIVQEQGPVWIEASGSQWQFGTNGNIVLPANGNILNQNGDSVLGAGSVIDITYSDLKTAVDGGELIPFNYYRITDYKTCYDQPDFNYVGNAITVGNYKDDAPVQPIIVLATSISTLAEEAYQPDYPKDRIRYDVSFNVTERLGQPAYGRITERIDAFNNRTDYDHRQIKFKRYRYYEINFNNPYQGTVEVSVVSATEMTVLGNGTNFTGLVVGNKIGFGNDNDSRVYEISNIASDTEMTVIGLGNVSLAAGTKMYPADWDEYSSYCQNNVDDPSTDFEEYYTFFTLEASDGNGNINNYIGNYANFYQWNENDFILANNVFQNRFQRNTFGDNCYNNTFFDDCTDNHIGNHFYNNITDDDFDSNVIGNYFYNNKITANFYDNRIGENFRDNYLVQNSFYRNNIMNDFRNNLIAADFQNNEVGSQFNNNKIYSDFYKNDIGNGYNYNRTYSQVYGNLIGNGFNSNDIFSSLYDNKIGEYFYNNDIGDLANRYSLEFNNNSIGNSFDNNQIRNSFRQNQIGNQFNNNALNGSFYINSIGNQFQNNTAGHDFQNNNIGHFGNQNSFGDYFHDNSIGNDFESNYITYGFSNNQIGGQFDNNTFGDTQYFTWNDTSIENLSERTYDTFNNALDGNIDNVILNKELIMHDTVNNEYHKVKFTQWTLSNYGGGFSYERTKVHPTVEATVYFTKTNFGSEVDIIVPGSLEITRGNVDGIYNVAEEVSWSGSSPDGTLWNSVYTEGNNGGNFEDNIIGNQFKGNYIKNGFQENKIGSFISGNEFLGGFYDNRISNYTFGNDFLGEAIGNTWDTGFNTNIIGPDFTNNQIGNQFEFNTIGQGFSYNQIGHQFVQNTIGDGFGFGYSTTQGNRIANNFQDNTIGEYFYNNTVADNFQDNSIGDYFQWNTVSAYISSTNFDTYRGVITGITSAFANALPVTSYTGVTGTTTGAGGGATFNVTVTEGPVVNVTINTGGNYYAINDTILILGSAIGLTDGVDDLTITISSVSTVPVVYEAFNCTIFNNSGNIARLSYYDDDDILTIQGITA